MCIQPFEQQHQPLGACCGKSESIDTNIHIMPSMKPTAMDDEPCCGPPSGPPAGPYERPGYRLYGFVERFVENEGQTIPIIHTRLNLEDRLGAMLVRIGIGRNKHMVAPGLYGIGTPDSDAPILVTANYKLSFDTLRRQLGGWSVWVLVLDTRGINVWCAAGKKTFGTEEVIRRVGQVRLDKIVGHRRLILPQLSATGVSGHQVKKGCGFSVVWGPVRASDIPTFLSNNDKADAGMRRVTFNLMERLVLIPLEIYRFSKSAAWSMLAIFILSGIGTDGFSVSVAWSRSLSAVSALIGGAIAGVVATPVFLPWIPGRAFSVKGFLSGIGVAPLLAFTYWGSRNWIEMSALLLLTLTVSSFLAMSFTGSTPFTSPTGVEREMRKAIPLQLLAIAFATMAWIVGGLRS